MTVKLPGWTPQGPPENMQCLMELRALVVQAVFAKWNKEGKPSSLLSIFYRVQDRTRELKATGRWPWKIPGKRTIDRRVNEAADPRFYDDRVPKIVAVKAGLYQPNPTLFGGSGRLAGFRDVLTSRRV